MPNVLMAAPFSVRVSSFPALWCVFWHRACTRRFPGSTSMSGKWILAAWALVLATPLGARAASHAEALKIYADTQHAQAQAGGGAAPTGFLPDTGFAPNGSKAFYPPQESGWSLVEDGLRVEPWVGELVIPGPPPVTLRFHSGYYLLGRQQNAAGNQWRGWVARVGLNGQLDTGFGSSGWLYTPAMDAVVDAAMGEGRAFFLGNFLAGYPMTRVLCLDLDTEESCFSPFAGIQQWNISASGPNTAAYAQRLLHDSRYGLFVAARVMNNASGQLAGIARIRASDGMLVESFGASGYYTGMSPTGHWTQNEVSLNDLAIPRAGTPGGTRLYVGGQGKRANGNQNAFTFALGPDSGTLASNWGWYWYWWNGDFAGQTAAISALSVLPDGRLAFAGWVNSAQSTYRASFVGVLLPDHGNDPAFCQGDSLSMCLLDVLVNGGSGANAWEYRPHSTPVAIAQTRSGDFILADRFQDNGFGPQPPIPNVHQRVRELPFASIRQVKATRELNFVAASSETRWSRPFDLWLGGTGHWSSSTGSGIGEEVIAMIGTRKWNGTDYDATMLHLNLQSELLSDGFEGP